MVYSGVSDSGDWIELAEEQLAHHLQLNRPTERLLPGQLDQEKWLRIR